MLLAYILLGGSVLLMMVQDVRKQTIPLVGLVIFAGTSFYLYLLEPHTEGLWMAGLIFVFFMVCQGIFYFFKREWAIGWGDAILSPFCGLWLYFHEVPLYFLSTGLFALLTGLFWCYRWQLRTFPMVPSLLLGLGTVLLIRCFLIGSGI